MNTLVEIAFAGAVLGPVLFALMICAYDLWTENAVRSERAMAVLMAGCGILLALAAAVGLIEGL